MSSAIERLVTIPRRVQESDQWKFKTTCKAEAHIDGKWFSKGEATIDWHIEFDVRDYGIKSLYPIVTGFEVTITEEFYDEVQDQDVEREHRFTQDHDFKDYEVDIGFYAPEDHDGMPSIVVVPRLLEIDSARKKIEINF